MAKGTLNKVILIGRVGADPEVRYMPNGNAIANVRLATNDGYKDKNTGQFVESTEWHRIVCFNKLGEIVAQYVKKGTLLYIEGRIRTNKWQDQSGQDRYSTEIVANEMQFLGSKDGGQNTNFSPSFEAGKTNTAPTNTRTQKKTTTNNTNNAATAEPVAQLDQFDDDDIPF